MNTFIIKKRAELNKPAPDPEPAVYRNPEGEPGQPTGLWNGPVKIARNNFVYKSLSSWSLNTAVGCEHACRFCYVPSVSTIKQGAALKEFGVTDPDAQWGQYVLLRPWDEKAFLSSLKSAEKTPTDKLNPDGNRAVMLSTTTDAYQTIRHPDPARQKELQQHSRFVVRRALELILQNSSLNVRILTRSPLARNDFDLYKKFGDRLVFGMSIPTLRNDLAKLYEPSAPAPSRRLETLKRAVQEGIPVYVALAPTPAEVDEADVRATLTELKQLDPITIFAEPINIRAENVKRIAAHAREVGLEMNTAVFDPNERWVQYAVDQLLLVEKVAKELGVADRLHLWPDKSFATDKKQKKNPWLKQHQDWFQGYWTRISEWPGRT